LKETLWEEIDAPEPRGTVFTEVNAAFLSNGM
jgi:hypothetical protein